MLSFNNMNAMYIYLYDQKNEVASIKILLGYDPLLFELR